MKKDREYLARAGGDVFYGGLSAMPTTIVNPDGICNRSCMFSMLWRSAWGLLANPRLDVDDVLSVMVPAVVHLSAELSLKSHGVSAFRLGLSKTTKLRDILLIFAGLEIRVRCMIQDIVFSQKNQKLDATCRSIRRLW